MWAARFVTSTAASGFGRRVRGRRAATCTLAVTRGARARSPSAHAAATFMQLEGRTTSSGTPWRASGPDRSSRCFIVRATAVKDRYLAVCLVHGARRRIPCLHALAFALVAFAVPCSRRCPTFPPPVVQEPPPLPPPVKVPGLRCRPCGKIYLDGPSHHAAGGALVTRMKRAGTAEEIYVHTCGDPSCDSRVAKCTNPHCGGWHVARNPSRFFDEVKKCERAYQRSQEVKVQQVFVGVEGCQPKAELGPLTPGQVPMARFHEVTLDVVAEDRGSGEYPMSSYGLPVLRSGRFDESVDAGDAEVNALCEEALHCFEALSPSSSPPPDWSFACRVCSAVEQYWALAITCTW